MTLIIDPALCALPQVIPVCAPRREAFATSIQIISRPHGAGTAVPVKEHAEPRAGRTAVMLPHGRDVGAARVAGGVEAEAVGLVAVRGIVGDPGGPIPPCCRRFLELGAEAVLVEVDLCPLAGLPLRRGGLGQVSDGHDDREEVWCDHVAEYWWKMSSAT